MARKPEEHGVGGEGWLVAVGVIPRCRPNSRSEQEEASGGPRTARTCSKWSNSKGREGGAERQRTHPAPRRPRLRVNRSIRAIGFQTKEDQARPRLAEATMSFVDDRPAPSRPRSSRRPRRANAHHSSRVPMIREGPSRRRRKAEVGRCEWPPSSMTSAASRVARRARSCEIWIQRQNHRATPAMGKGGRTRPPKLS